MNKEFQWTDELTKEFCEYAGFRIGKNVDIREQLNYLIEDFKASHTPEVKRDWEIIEERKICYDGYWTGETKIFSVRRLSDNEVFSVGEDTTYGKVDRFIISRGEIEVHFTNGNGATLAPISKLPQRTKLFTTSDGKDVFVGDTVFYIREWDICSWVVEHYMDTPDRSLQTFSTNDAAKEYVTLNKPCLSLTDILNAWYSDEDFKRQCLAHSETYYRADIKNKHPLFKRLEQVAKSKQS